MTGAPFERGGPVRLACFSHNVTAGFAPELRAGIDATLRTAQQDDVQTAITGALASSRGALGQVIEGSERAVEETFERIQPGPRLDDVRLIEVRPIEERSFAGWSMGFCGREALLDRISQAANAWT